MCELICLAELIGGCLGGILLILLVLVVYDLRWSKDRKAREKRNKSANSVEVELYFRNQG